MTRSKKFVEAEDEESVVYKEQMGEKTGAEVKENDVKGEVNVGKALIDLGASINLMPLSMCKRLGEWEIMPTRMTLQLADRSITRRYGVIEDVLVWVKHFIFPTYFVVMDISKDTDIPVIMGRPFMLTASCIVDMGKRKLELGFEDQKIDFDLFSTFRGHASEHTSGAEYFTAKPIAGSASRLHPDSRAI
ncbi:uncharacterized protein LOC114391574 [Glycine soja]|uniref:uncharacterized protein n=1 Tax=Glycine max TaxID=3847 RepID=UPI0003DE914C|nr:uncharacterized protein LOC102664167 [Glycine max]XP_028208369.1 uncharacterized protein LOC114391574 [Glycine soja]|eukprot:XP_006601542.1 uncharacterized protein LOC102664167 [Glycine max]